jgi:hypothetical protein
MLQRATGVPGEAVGVFPTFGSVGVLATLGAAVLAGAGVTRMNWLIGLGHRLRSALRSDGACAPGDVHTGQRLDAVRDPLHHHVAMNTPVYLEVLRTALSRALADVPKDVLGHDRVSVHVATREGVVPAGIPDGRDWLDPTKDAVGLLRIDGNVVSLDAGEYESLVMEIAGRIQDAVVDLTGDGEPQSLAERESPRSPARNPAPARAK